MLTWLELLKKISTWPEPIRVTEVAEHFDIPVGEASIRMHRLRGWGFVKYLDRIRKGFGGFMLTEAGRRRIEKG